MLYKQVKKQYDSFTKKADIKGVYTACFSNEFSTFSHKLVYLDWQTGPEDPLPGVAEHLTAMTQVSNIVNLYFHLSHITKKHFIYQMESNSQMIHENMNKVVDYQTHHRLRESQGRKRAEDLNGRVTIWAVGETLAIVCISVGQVMILKNFFSDRKTPSVFS